MTSGLKEKPKKADDVTRFKAAGFEFSGPTWFALFFLAFCFFVAYGIFFSEKDEKTMKNNANTEVSHSRNRSKTNSNTKTGEVNGISTDEIGEKVTNEKNENEENKCDGSWGEKDLDCPI